MAQLEFVDYFEHNGQQELTEKKDRALGGLQLQESCRSRGFRNCDEAPSSGRPNRNWNRRSSAVKLVARKGGKLRVVFSRKTSSIPRIQQQQESKCFKNKSQ
ncbi:unnamed protein product [Amoebophrya sp. A120]|nr:unnamed protein product [Amoebophrya sp. A120]|eukprot:GSA120T00008657001.1